jgi:hypothetical protein
LSESNNETWHAFAFLIITAVAYYYASGPIVFIAATVIGINVWLWLFTAWFIFGFMRGLLGGRPPC